MNSKLIAAIAAIIAIAAVAVVVIPADDTEAVDALEITDVQYTPEGSNTILIITFNKAVSGNVSYEVTGDITDQGILSIVNEGLWGTKLTRIVPTVDENYNPIGNYTITVKTINEQATWSTQTIVDPDTYTIDATGASNVEIGYTGDVTDNTVAANAPLTITVSAIENYTIQSVTVTMGDEELTPVVEEGVYTYTIEAVTGNIVIVAATTSTGGADEPYSITITNPENGMISVANAADGTDVTGETQLTGSVTLNVTVTPNVENVTSVTVNGQLATDNGDGTYTCQIPVTGATEITAVIETEETQYWDVTFVVNGETVDTIQVEDEQLIPDAEVPSIPDENFLYWATEDGEEYDFDTPVPRDIMLHAVFADDPVTGNTIQLPDSQETITVNPGETLTLTGSGTLTVTGSMYIYGTIVYDGVEGATANIEVAQGAVLRAFAGATVPQDVRIGGAGDIDISDAMSTMTINNDVSSSNTYSQTQIVVIGDTLNLRNGTTTTILGELQVNEGVILTVESGATLVVDSQTARMIVNGTIEVEEGATVLVNEADSVTVYGSIESDGTISIHSDVSIEENGSVLVNNGEGSSIDVQGGLTVRAGGQLEIRGSMTVQAADAGQAAISNMGTIVLNGAVLEASSTINMAANGAVVDIRSFTAAAGASLTITDDGLYLYDNRTDDSKDLIVGTSTDTETGADYTGINTVTFAPVAADVGVRNVTVTEVVTSERNDDGKLVYTYGIALAGTPAIVDETTVGTGYTGSYTIQVDGVNIMVGESDTLTLGTSVILNVAGGYLNVYGTITATATDSAVQNAGEITVTGMVDSVEQLKGGVINAARYETDEASGTVFHYTDLNTAVANGAQDIRVLGTVAVTESLEIPSPVIVRADGTASIVIGSTDSRDVTVTVADGATVRNFNNGGSIVVDGTLVFDNSRDNRSNYIVSDVSVVSDPGSRYTNIYTALANAQPGETVTITKTDGAVVLDSNITVPAEVTLSVPNSRTLTVGSGVTVTVDGTLLMLGTVNATNADGVVDTEGFNPVDPATGEEKDEYSAIIVNGAVMSPAPVPYANGYYIAGAYYNLVNESGNYWYVTPVAAAAEVSNDVTDGAIEIHGDNTAGDVSFTGDVDQTVTVTVATGAKLEATSVTLSYAAIAAQGQFDGVIDSAVGSVAFVNATGFIVEDTVADETEIMTLAGIPVQSDAEGADATVTVSSGEVTVDENLSITNGLGSFDIANGATVTVTGQGAALSAVEMSVDGTLVATDGGQVSVSSILTVRGTFTVAPADRENNVAAGSASVGQLFVGIAQDDRTGGYGDASAATVTADAITGIQRMIVSADSTVTGDLTQRLASTEFYLEDALWITVYVSGAYNGEAIAHTFIASDNTAVTTYGYQPADLTESRFLAWNDENGDAVTAPNNGSVGVGATGYERVYADIDYNVYDVIVIADGSIGSVAIDGNLLVKSGNGFVLPNGMLTAGQHTISYVLNPNYSGDVTLSSDGAAVSGMTFTLSGDFDQPIILNLGGATPSDTTVVIENNGSDGGMGLTEILLIILVILIVIMAIIVALRLMRS